MTMAYDGEENKIRDAVATVVDTYHPAGEHGSEYKGTAYDQQIESMQQKEVDAVVPA